MPWSINGTEIFGQLQDGFPMNTEEVLDWALGLRLDSRMAVPSR